MSKTLSIIIPVYNEERTVDTILEKLNALEVNGISKELIIVNDCSTDRTREIVTRFIETHPESMIRLVNHEVNKGKGAALRSGIPYAKGDFTIFQDADLEYDPDEYSDLLKPLLKDKADVVYGSRFIGSKPHRVLFYWHFMGNKLITFLCNLVSNLNLTDVECCYKIFRTDILRKIELKENRFGIEPEITIKAARIPGIRIYEVGVSYYGRTYQEGKKITVKDGFHALWCILRYGVFG